ncbi:MAG: cbb3-type cytochrome c oxidase subunit II [Actinomycetota bacterium]|nr:cbb3-type cytochrome c oxidase subunit II [Actinomycetota bacterium]
MSDLLKKVAKLLGVPESLIQRSSEARAEASGKSTEEVLQSWSGGEAVESAEEEVVEEESAEEEVVEEVLVPAKNENTKAISAIMVAAMLFSGIFTLTLPLSQVHDEAQMKNEVYEISDGAIIYNQEGCQDCHSQNIRQIIPDAGIGRITSIELLGPSMKTGGLSNTGLRRVGPDLSTIGDREPTNNKNWLKRYLNNPSSLRPNVPHPKYDYLSSKEMDNLIEYLVSLGEEKNE